MFEHDLKNKLIRLAHSNRDLRPHLLPLLKDGASDWIPGDLKENKVRDYLKIPKGKTIPMGKLKAEIAKLRAKSDSGEITKDESSMLKSMNLAVQFKEMGKKAKDAKPPKKVQEIAKDVEEKGGDPGLAYAVAWSVYCKYKEPGSPHCHKPATDYFPGRK